MYYNSNKVNNYYYNAYKKEVSKLQNERKLATIKDIVEYILFFLVLLFLLLASFYLYHYINTKESLLNQKALYTLNQSSTITVNIKKEDQPQKINRYNKIVLTKNEVSKASNSPFIALNNDLHDIVIQENTTNYNHTKEITKEVTYQKNKMRIIIVQKGDTLSKIAKKAYGDNTDYKKIFAANPEIIQNPNQIYVGQRLRIPS